jgi:hypothetical protein
MMASDDRTKQGSDEQAYCTSFAQSANSPLQAFDIAEVWHVWHSGPSPSKPMQVLTHSVSHAVQTQSANSS